MFTFLSQINWGAVASVAAAVPFVVACVVAGLREAQRLTPQQRRDWLQAGLRVAVAVEEEALKQGTGQQGAALQSALAGHVNAFLKLHGVTGVAVKPEDIRLLLMDAKLLLGGK